METKEFYKLMLMLEWIKAGAIDDLTEEERRKLDEDLKKYEGEIYGNKEGSKIL